MSRNIERKRRDFLDVLQSTMMDNRDWRDSEEVRQARDALVGVITEDLHITYGAAISVDTKYQGMGYLEYTHLDFDKCVFVYEMVYGEAFVQFNDGELENPLPYAWNFQLRTPDPVQLVDNWLEYSKHLKWVESQLASSR